MPLAHGIRSERAAPVQISRKRLANLQGAAGEVSGHYLRTGRQRPNKVARNVKLITYLRNKVILCENGIFTASRCVRFSYH